VGGEADISGCFSEHAQTDDYRLISKLELISGEETVTVVMYHVEERHRISLSLSGILNGLTGDAPWSSILGHRQNSKVGC